ncbi:uncharacterized protein CCOS01_08476 [Colletotrichum costaricense]|uniref:Uncharacterized protein n=1 Tax=Colletotrichum costaricense TaxID=1209916 RepID=A0AAJ0DZN7_9PEZI|nr:uncharacterized protein CCOS01_08476 [Colletotrichum costaricense]KAK1526058.1 hypothetical protein CCOS01_08476 [Colletotrichum costaricense]
MTERVTKKMSRRGGRYSGRAASKASSDPSSFTQSMMSMAKENLDKEKENRARLQTELQASQDLIAQWETILKISSPKQSNLPSGQVPTTTEENSSPAVSTYAHRTEGTEANDTNPTADNTAPSGRSRNISVAPFSGSRNTKERATATQATSSTAMLVDKPGEESEVEHSDGHDDEDKSEEDDDANEDDGEYVEDNDDTEFMEE